MQLSRFPRGHQFELPLYGPLNQKDELDMLNWRCAADLPFSMEDLARMRHLIAAIVARTDMDVERVRQQMVGGR